MADTRWFVIAAGREQGPISAAQVRAYVAAGKITPDMPLRREGMAQPVPARQIKGLFAEADAPAPDTATTSSDTAPSLPPVMPTVDAATAPTVSASSPGFIGSDDAQPTAAPVIAITTRRTARRAETTRTILPGRATGSRAATRRPAPAARRAERDNPYAPPRTIGLGSREGNAASYDEERSEALRIRRANLRREGAVRAIGMLGLITGWMYAGLAVTGGLVALMVFGLSTLMANPAFVIGAIIGVPLAAIVIALPLVAGTLLRRLHPSGRILYTIFYGLNVISSAVSLLSPSETTGELIGDIIGRTILLGIMTAFLVLLWSRRCAPIFALAYRQRIVPATRKLHPPKPWWFWALAGLMGLLALLLLALFAFLAFAGQMALREAFATGSGSEPAPIEVRAPGP